MQIELFNSYCAGNIDDDVVTDIHPTIDGLGAILHNGG